MRPSPSGVAPARRADAGAAAPPPDLTPRAADDEARRRAQSIWEQVRRLDSASTMMRNLLASLEPIRVEGSVGGREMVVLRPAAMVQDQSQRRLDRIRELVRQVDAHLDVTLTTDVSGKAGEAAVPEPKPEPDDRVRDDPLIRRAIELFDARVVRVRPRED